MMTFSKYDNKSHFLYDEICSSFSVHIERLHWET